MAYVVHGAGGVALLFGLTLGAPTSPQAQERMVTRGHCDLSGTYDVMKAGSTRVLGVGSITCGPSRLCIARDDVREAQLEPRAYNIHRWLVVKRKGDGSWPRRFIATDGRGCSQVLFANGTLWRRR